MKLGYGETSRSFKWTKNLMHNRQILDTSDESISKLDAAFQYKMENTGESKICFCAKKKNLLVDFTNFVITKPINEMTDTITKKQKPRNNVQVQEKKKTKNASPRTPDLLNLIVSFFSFKRLCQWQSCIGHSLTQESMKPLHENPPKLLRRLMMYCLHSILGKSLQYWPSQVLHAQTKLKPPVCSCLMEKNTTIWSTN